MDQDPSKKKPTTRGKREVYRIGDDHSGRDEMNLAGNPFALLDARRSSETTHIKIEWSRELDGGRKVNASWEVNGHAELGLPGPSDELVYLVLLELTREAANGGQWPQQVHFSRYALLEAIGWPNSAKFYKMLRDCFARLQAVAIQAEWAYFDARTRKPAPSVGFHILESYLIADEPKGRKSAQSSLPLSYFKWSDQLYQSFTSGNVRSLALEYIKDLEIPTARRLFRYLDMHRNSQKPPRQTFTVRLMKLRDHIGMVNLRHISKIKERLMPAHEELIETGYLASYHFTKSKQDGQEMVVYTFADGAPSSLSQPNIVPQRNGVNAPKLPSPPPQESSQELYPQEASALFQSLPEDEQEALRSLARDEIDPDFWDRLEDPASPMSFGLWELVQEKYPEKFRD